MKITNYDDYDALGLAQLIAKKEVTPSELLETAIDRTTQYNPSINAIINEMYDIAWQTSKNGINSGPFAGVPFLIKDLGVLYQGVATTNGSRFYKDFIPDHDSEVVKRFKKAGFVTFGKTNTPELGLAYTTESNFYGTCHNPWDLSLTPGGSSGGAAAAVAARIIPMAHASDGGGSIRVPASCCGIFGLKPTRARVPAGPDMGEVWSGLGCTLAVSISVRDTAAMLDCLSGREVGDPYCAPPQPYSFLEALEKPLRPLKIAFSTSLTVSPTPVPIDPSCINALNHAINLCAELGHHLEEAKPTYHHEFMQQALHVIIAGNVKNNLRLWSKTSGKKICPQELEAVTWKIAEIADTYHASDYANALFLMHNQSRKIAEFFTQYDLLLTPTLATPPVKIGHINSMLENIDEYFSRSEAFSPFTWVYNMTGQPAMSVPLYWTQNKIPIGVQFIGGFGDEVTLLQLAKQLEQASPWKNHKPPLQKGEVKINETL